MPSKLPGVKARHAIISDNCRQLHGTVKAFDIASEQLRESYLAITTKRDDPGVKYHLVLTVQNVGCDEGVEV